MTDFTSHFILNITGLLHSQVQVFLKDYTVHGFLFPDQFTCTKMARFFNEK